MAKVTYSEFVSSYLVSDGDPGNALYLNKAPNQLKIEVDENSAAITTLEGTVSTLQSSDFLSGNSDKVLQSGVALSISGDTLTLTKGDGSTDEVTISTANYYTTGLTFDTSSGILTAVMNGTSNKSIDLDGRYSLTSHTHSYNPTIGTNTDINTSGATIVDNIYVTNGVVTSMGTRVLTPADIGAEPALVSGTNIKTVNGKDITGSGNVEFAATSDSNNVFIQNQLVVSSNYTVPTGVGAMSTGPITINTGVVVTISNGSRWVVI